MHLEKKPSFKIVDPNPSPSSFIFKLLFNTTSSIILDFVNLTVRLFITKVTKIYLAYIF